MSFGSLLATSPKGCEKELQSCKKESKKQEPWKVVSLTVPDKFRLSRSSSIPDVIRIRQETHKKKTSRKILTHLSHLIVPEIPEFGTSEENFKNLKTFSLGCIPSIKRCTLEEIHAVNSRYARVVRKRHKNNFVTSFASVTRIRSPEMYTRVAFHSKSPTQFNSILISNRS